MMSTSPMHTASAPEDERLPAGKTIAFGLQHILTMYCGIIAPPLIIGPAAGLSMSQTGDLVTAALFVSGLATLLQSLGVHGIGSRLPLVQGVSFAGVSTMLALLTAGGGLPSVFGAIIAASVIGFLIAPLFARIIRFFPPVVTGSVVTVIGLSLIPVAIRWIMGGDPTAEDWGAPGNIGTAAMTLGLVLLMQWLGPPTLRRLSILLAMTTSYLVALLLGHVDFSLLKESALFAVPRPFAFGWPTFDIGAIVSMLLVALVLLTETTAGLLAVGEVIGTPVQDKRIAKGLRADMLASACSPIFGAFSQSVFAQNIGLVAITGVKSRFVVAAGGGVLVVLGLFPFLGHLAASIPLPILGGGGLLLFGTVAASGIRTLSRVDYHDNMNLVIVATALVMGMIPMVMPTFYDRFPEWVQVLMRSGIGTTCLVAVVLNAVFNPVRRDK